MSAEADQEEEGAGAARLADAWFERDFAQVERLAREGLEAAPDDAVLQAWLGLALWCRGEVAAARPVLEAAVRGLRTAMARADGDAREALGWALDSVADRLIDATEGPGQAEAARFVLESLGLKHAPSLRLRAEAIEARDGNPVAALAALKEALAASPADADTHLLAARLFARLGKRAGVLKHLTRALALADGAVAVRRVVRYDFDFDGLRDDPEFAALVDLLPAEPALRPLYQALEARDFARVVDLAAVAPPGLDALYPLRDALEALARAEGSERWADAQARTQADIDAREADDEASAAWARFRGDA